MSLTLSRVVAAIGAGLLVGAPLLAPIAAGATTTTPPWEAGNSNAVGTLTLYDANGNVVTSGHVKDAPMAAYVVGSAVVRSGDTQALVDAAQPNPDLTPDQWNTDIWNSPTNQPITTGPSDIRTISQTQPVAALGSGDETLAQFVNEFPNTGPTGIGCAYSGTASGCTDTDYEDIYQIRLLTSNGSDDTQNYDVADVEITNPTYSNGI